MISHKRSIGRFDYRVKGVVFELGPLALFTRSFQQLAVLPFTITSLLTYMTLAVFVNRSIKKKVRGVRDEGGSWWKGGGVGEAVMGGEGDEAVDPCLVILNRP